MNYEWIWEKKFQSENLKKKTVKIKEIAACEQKTISEKANFCSNTVFSLL